MIGECKTCALTNIAEVPAYIAIDDHSGTANRTESHAWAEICYMTSAKCVTNIQDDMPSRKYTLAVILGALAAQL